MKNKFHHHSSKEHLKPAFARRKHYKHKDQDKRWNKRMQRSDEQKHRHQHKHSKQKTCQKITISLFLISHYVTYFFCNFLVLILTLESSKNQALIISDRLEGIANCPHVNDKSDKIGKFLRVFYWTLQLQTICSCTIFQIRFLAVVIKFPLKWRLEMLLWPFKKLVVIKNLPSYLLQCNQFSLLIVKHAVTPTEYPRVIAINQLRQVIVKPVRQSRTSLVHWFSLKFFTGICQPGLYTLDLLVYLCLLSQDGSLPLWNYMNVILSSIDIMKWSSCLKFITNYVTVYH